ncbi:uncharacterized protein LOC113227433 [Hyposmocoma kahamanoa]|uniref:uncharacterized protein LOC113227433 n=1 Tax=Hyposmocoma kahamanoa TaxID=1477025 RepID=UPI000E6D62B5|nr:uncharacterized protein LOC113227433 [Hyposmocoma kahamanoa]
MILTGTNLGQRQHDFNTKVNEAANKRIDFQQIKQNPETSDVDKLFKIDLASKYKNIEYFIEVLKSGDSFHIIRVLKHNWMYDDKYSHIINVDYLEHNVFPYMSIKMKRKLLTNISNNVTNEKRSKCFYIYCVSKCLYHNATKFLLHTSESFKLNAIQTQMDMLNNLDDNLKFFIGDSFELVHAYLKEKKNGRNAIFYELRHMYSISSEEYLDVVEKYSKVHDDKPKCLGLRISKDIMKNHKKRVLHKPRLYIPIINKNILVKHSTSEEAKNYLKALLPENVDHFWSNIFISKYRSIIDALAIGEKFKFLKKIFSDKYPGERFEMKSDFYLLDYYEIMTEEERELWALEHLALNDDDNYQYYKFLPFDKAFERMTKEILVTPDALQRSRILETVVETAKTKDQILKFLEYYYNRHANERYKDSFISVLLDKHSVLDFEEDCFNIVLKLMRSVKTSFYEDKFNALIIIYSILRGKDFTQNGLPVCLKGLIRTSFSITQLTDHVKKLDPERKEITYQGLREISIDVLKNLLADTSNEYYHYELKVFIQFYLSFIKYFQKPNSDVPEAVAKYIESKWEDFSNHAFFVDKKMTRDKVMRFLKKDAKLACDFQLIEKYITESPVCRDEDFRLTTVLRKLKVYFSHDIAQEYLKYFSQCLTEKAKPRQLIHTAIHGIFQLADENRKLDFCMKHVPENPKIDHVEIDERLLVIQEGICRYAFYARPNVPLSKILLYVKGDYVPFCLQMFNYFVANLPPQLCLQFVEALINAPVKIQKHGLRLAFQCFSVEDLKKIIVKAWTKNKNISLRVVMYTSMFQIIQNQDPNNQIELFELFKTMTLDLHKDDHEDTFRVIRKAYLLPEHLKGDYYEAAWKAVSKFPDSTKGSQSKRAVLLGMVDNISLLNKEFLLSVIEDHIRDVLMEQQNLEEQSICSAKWDLVTTLIIKVTDEEGNKTNLKLVKLILQKCLEKWNEVNDEIFTMRQLCHDFINRLVEKNTEERDSYSKSNAIFDSILQDLLNVLPVEEVYLIFWDLKLTMIINKVADFGREKIKYESEKHSRKTEILRDVSLNFANEIGALVHDLVEKGLYHTSFVEKIADKIDSKIVNLQNMLNINSINCFDMYISIADSLTNLNMAEIYLLVARILPLECEEGYEEEYRKLLEKIKSYNNSEVRCCVYQRFMNNGFKRRKYY